jgi:hypothetical protein
MKVPHYIVMLWLLFSLARGALPSTQIQPTTLNYKQQNALELIKMYEKLWLIMTASNQTKIDLFEAVKQLDEVLQGSGLRGQEVFDCLYARTSVPASRWYEMYTVLEMYKQRTPNIELEMKLYELEEILSLQYDYFEKYMKEVTAKNSAIHYQDIDFYTCDDDGNNFLIAVALLNLKSNMIAALLFDHPDINHTNKRGLSALSAAVLCGHYEAAELLLQHGANINQKFDNKTLFEVICRGDYSLDRAERKQKLQELLAAYSR